MDVIALFGNFVFYGVLFAVQSVAVFLLFWRPRSLTPISNTHTVVSSTAFSTPTPKLDFDKVPSVRQEVDSLLKDSVEAETTLDSQREDEDYDGLLKVVGENKWLLVKLSVPGQLRNDIHQTLQQHKQKSGDSTIHQVAHTAKNNYKNNSNISNTKHSTVKVFFLNLKVDSFVV